MIDKNTYTTYNMKLKEWTDSEEGKLLQAMYNYDRHYGSIIKKEDFIHTIGKLELCITHIMIKGKNEVVTRYTLVVGAVVSGSVASTKK